MSNFTHQIIVLASSDTDETSYENYLIDGVTPINDQYSVNLFKDNWTLIDLFKDFIDFYTEEYPDYQEALSFDKPNYFEAFVTYYASKRFNSEPAIFIDMLWLPYFSDAECSKFLEHIYIIPIDVLKQYKYLGY